MVLVAAGMSTQMLANATSMGLIDSPPHFALSRLFNVIANGVVPTLQDPLATIITVVYTGQPAIPPSIGTGPVSPPTGPVAATYQTNVQTQALHFGPFASPFFFGIAGIITYFLANVTFLDPLAATGNGTGQLTPGGLVFDATECFDNMKNEAASEDLMVVNLTHLGGDPFATIPDPTTGAPLSLGDLFVQAEILLHAVADQLTIELAKTTATLTASGGFNPLDPVLVLPTITTTIL